MGYLESTLADGETVTYKAQFHWTYTLGAWLLMALGLIISLPFWALAQEKPNYQWVAYLIIGLCVFQFFRLMITKWTTEVVITNRRFVYKRGWISRTTQELPMRRIEEVNLVQSVLGRIFGFGKISVSGTGGDKPIVTPNLDDPLALRRALDR